jgi:HEAT repeat protein
LSRASRHADAAPGLRHLLALNGLGVAAEIELLRALGDRIMSFQPEAALAFGRAAAASRTFEQRFLLLGPAAQLAAADAAAVGFVKRALSDPDPYLRATAARLAPDVPAIHGPLLAATRDEAVRVREASALRLGELSFHASGPALVERLRDDPWPLVRAAAARSLVSAPPARAVDKALAAALRDESARVRSLSLRALGQRGARSELPAIEERFRDREEEPEVRGAAARALGELCDMSVLDELTRAASKLLVERPSPADMSLGNAALGALGRLDPPDLEQRLAPLVAAKGRPDIEFLVNRAPESRKRCEPRPPSN